MGEEKFEQTALVKAVEGAIVNLLDAYARNESERVAVRSAENKTTVSVLDNQGRPDASAAAQRIAKLLAEDLK